jgi:hypothetical protein
LLSAIIDCGASRCAASTNNVREATYTPEFRHDSTAVRTIRFMIVAAPGTCVRVSAAANGDEPAVISVHGTIATTSSTDST